MSSVAGQTCSEEAVPENVGTDFSDSSLPKAAMRLLGNACIWALPGWLVLVLGAPPALFLKLFTKKWEAGDFDSHKWEKRVAGC